MLERSGGSAETATDACTLDGAPALDLLWGADAIARFLGCTAKAVYRLAESQRAPIFKVNARLCARRSTLAAFIAAKEQKLCA
jgi:hypothetical protein